MTRFLADNSVLQRIALHPVVRERLDALVDAGHELCSCSVSMDEARYSARNLDEAEELERRFRTGDAHLGLSPEMDDVTADIRTALFRAGSGRAAGVVDVQIAAVAICHDAAVLHYDVDFEHIATAFPVFRHAWVVPRGTID